MVKTKENLSTAEAGKSWTFVRIWVALCRPGAIHAIAKQQSWCITAI
jgi:hypothetical protein